jgi:hypothetical protein
MEAANMAQRRNGNMVTLGMETGTEAMSEASSHQIGGDHYASKAVQPWDAMSAWMSHEAFAGFLQGNCVKYLARYRDKNGLQDLDKCQHYLNKLIEVESNRGMMAENILQFQAGREAFLFHMRRDERRSNDWLEGYDQEATARKPKDANE